jgi:hypothetical protein
MKNMILALVIALAVATPIASAISVDYSADKDIPRPVIAGEEDIEFLPV